MKRILTFFICIVFLITPIYARKKVALVLSGGGAKGAAHIGALKVIENAGIPIDIIVGTSMGAIVGALYSVGYTPEQMDSLLTHQDWSYIFSDQVVNNSKLSLDEKMRRSKYLLNVPFKKRPEELLMRGGLLQGRNVNKLLESLMYEYPDSMSYDNLPIPFACVSFDYARGKEVVFHGGVLAQSVRSSMNIPGLFSPFMLDSMALVDGGMVNNYPADIAREMGADILIGIDVADPFKTKDELNSISSIVAQFNNLLGKEKYEANSKLLDINIKSPTYPDYGTLDFDNKTLKKIISIGRDSAINRWSDLIALKQKIGLDEMYLPLRRPHYNLSPFFAHMDGSVSNLSDSLSSERADISESTVNVGGRFDTENITSLIFNTRFKIGNKRPHYFDGTIRLGKHMYGQVDYEFKPFNIWTTTFTYRFASRHQDAYYKGKKLLNMDYFHQFANLTFSRSWRNIRVELSGCWDIYHLNDLLSEGYYQQFYVGNQNFFTYRFRLDYDSYDDPYFPTEGVKWSLQVDDITDDLVTYKYGHFLFMTNLHWSHVYSFHPKWTMINSFDLKGTTRTEVPFFKRNQIGGIYPGIYSNHQIPFAGISHMEVVDNNFASYTFTSRYQFVKNQYFTASTSVAQMSHYLRDFLYEPKVLWGMNIGYSYDSLLGPIDLRVGVSSYTKKGLLYLNVGYVF